ncbi:hypothetical protein JL09_g6458 [Pichia kudriavzevii]|uniref:Uncharacterized protein n=1 Tax=Pichia kudriavzevii TaxID=4909 RepID=A0A099NPH2_PICKU|nr:hypothetical protein JL09_g6460 [Pichia kudriavzevii]KGK34395.1 hypothetical protein JL09_g6458 [Pichia kudriavzevii]
MISSYFSMMKDDDQFYISSYF